MHHENRVDAGSVCSDHFSVTVVVAKEWEMIMGRNRNFVTGSPLQNAAAILLGDIVTEEVTETGADVEMISVSDTPTEIPAKRKRGRPAKDSVAMTDVERSRQYRERHRPAWQRRRVCLDASTVERAEKLAAARGVSVEDAIDKAVYMASYDNVVVIWSTPEFELIKAAAAKSGDTVEAMVNFALLSVRDEWWDEKAEQRLRYMAKKATEAQTNTADAA